MAFASLADLKRSRNDFSSLAKSVETLSKGGSGGNQQDDRFWQPEVDKVGNGQATIRFLTTPVGEDFPWVQMFSHGFKNDETGKWFIDNCPTTIGQECPVNIVRH